MEISFASTKIYDLEQWPRGWQHNGYVLYGQRTFTAHELYVDCLRIQHSGQFSTRVRASVDTCCACNVQSDECFERCLCTGLDDVAVWDDPDGSTQYRAEQERCDAGAYYQRIVH